MGQRPEEYSDSDIHAALELIPDELRETVLGGIARAKEQREFDSRAYQMKYTIAEFATALHLNEANRNQPGEPVDLIGWDIMAASSAAAIIASYDESMIPILPASVKKTIAYVYDRHEFLARASRDEVDQKLVPFGYPTERILDDQVALSAETGIYGTVEDIKSRFAPYLEHIVLDDYIASLEQTMRQDLKDLGYILPELEADNSYGHELDGSDSYPRFSEDMLP